VVHRHEITYLAPAGYGDELELVTEVQEMHGARAVRRTTMRLLGSGQPVLEMRTEWVWVRASDGRPQRLPPVLLRAFADD